MVGTGRFELPNGSALPRTPRRLDWSRSQANDWMGRSRPAVPQRIGDASYRDCAEINGRDGQI